MMGTAPEGGWRPGRRFPSAFQAACESNAAAALVIFVILSILSIPLLLFPNPDWSRCWPGAMELGGQDDDERLRGQSPNPTGSGSDP